MLNTNNRAAGSSDPLGPDCREEAMAHTGIQELILQELEGLAEDRILEVLDFIRFLKSRQGEHPPLPGRRLIPQPEALRILAELDRIRAEVEARYGVYPGDPVQEVREAHERRMEEAWKPSS
jgi:hypothetical protein